MSTALTTDIAPEDLAARLSLAHDHAWLDRFSRELDRRRAVGALQRVLATWQLSQAEAARVFGVSRQALGKWANTGVPATQAAAVADLASATDLLLRYLRRDRIPGVVRRPFPAAEGRNLVDVATESPALALDFVRSMFDFANVQS